MSWVRLQSIIEKIAIVFLIIAGLLSIVVSIVDFACDLQDPRLLKAVPDVTLLLLSVLAVGLGLERLISYRRLERTLNSLAGGVRLSSWEEIYAAGSELVKLAEWEVRATSFGEKKWAGPDQYLKLVAKTAKQRCQHRGGFKYRVVFGYRGKPDLDRAEHILHRADIFRSHQALDMLEMRCIDTNWGVDLLIIDDRHVIIAFPMFETQAETQALKLGIKFVDQPQLVEQIRVWYDAQLWNKSTKIDLDEIRELVNAHRDA